MPGFMNCQSRPQDWQLLVGFQPSKALGGCLPLRGLTVPLYTTTNRVSRFPSEHLQVLAEIFKAPVHPGAQRVERHPLDLGQIGEHGVPAIDRRRRDSARNCR
jgi:hypothetical protein